VNEWEVIARLEDSTEPERKKMATLGLSAPVRKSVGRKVTTVLHVENHEANMEEGGPYMKNCDNHASPFQSHEGCHERRIKTPLSSIHRNGSERNTRGLIIIAV